MAIEVNGIEILTRKEFWERHDAIFARTDIDRAEQSREACKLHRDYYGRYVKAFNIKLHNNKLLERCAQAIEAGDEHMNSPYTDLKRDWDVLTLSPNVVRVLRQAGEGYSASVNTCVWKEAARQQIEAAKK